MDTAESPPTISMTEPLPPSLLFFVSSFHHLIPIKLNDHNYAIWKLQCEGALKASSLFDYVQHSQSPSPTITDPTGTPIPNPAYFKWFVVESHLRSCLISTLTPSILDQVTHTSTALELCEFLKLKFTDSDSLEKKSGGEVPSNPPHDNTTLTTKFGSASNAHNLFDVSPNRDLLAIADGSAESDVVPLSHGTTMFSEPDVLVVNQPDSRFVEDRFVLSFDEMIGYQTHQESGNFQRMPVQQKSEPQNSEAKKQATPETNHSGTKRKSPTPHCANDLSSDPLKTTDDPNIQKKLNGGNAIVLVGTTDDPKIQNSYDTKVEGNSLQVSKILNGGKAIESEGTTDDHKIRNCLKRKLEEKSSQVNKKPDGGNTTEAMGLWRDLQVLKTKLERMKRFNQLLDGGNAIDVVSQAKRMALQRHLEVELTKLQEKLRLQWNSSVQGNKQLNGGKAMELRGITADQKVQNPQERDLEENSLQVPEVVAKEGTQEAQDNNSVGSAVGDGIESHAANNGKVVDDEKEDGEIDESVENVPENNGKLMDGHV